MRGEKVGLVPSNCVPTAGEVIGHQVVEVQVWGHLGNLHFAVVLGSCGEYISKAWCVARLEGAYRPGRQLLKGICDSGQPHDLESAYVVRI